MGAYRPAIMAALLFAGVYFVAEAAARSAMQGHLKSAHASLGNRLDPLVYFYWIAGTCLLVFVGMCVPWRKRPRSTE